MSPQLVVVLAFDPDHFAALHVVRLHELHIDAERHDDLAVLHLAVANLRIHEFLRLQLAANPLLLDDAAGVVVDRLLDDPQRLLGDFERWLERMLGRGGDVGRWRVVDFGHAVDWLAKGGVVLVRGTCAGRQTRGAVSPPPLAKIRGGLVAKESFAESPYVDDALTAAIICGGGRQFSSVS